MSKLKLNQVIAIADGEKSRQASTLTKTYQILGKAELFEGLTRRYTPSDDAGEKLPNEDKNVQYTVKDAIQSAVESCTNLFNITSTLDLANCKAKADIVVDDQVVAKDVPVSTLLFLSKRLEEQATFVTALPTLDPAEKWSNDASGLMRSETKQTNRTKKLPRNHVKAEATEHHPAQVEVYHEDLVIGHFDITRFSGAISRSEKQEMLDRVRKLQNAVKVAREQANMIEVENSDLGEKILDFIYKK